MDEITQIAAAETIAVLYNTKASLVAQIPYAILRALEEKAKEYKGEIRLAVNAGLDKQEISDEARAILSILYKDYWCDEEKHQEMNSVFDQKLNEYNEEQKEEFNPFKDAQNYDSIVSQKAEENSTVTSEVISEDKALLYVPKKWYIALIEKIISFFES